MKKETTIEVLATIFTHGELISISNDIAETALQSQKDGFNATAESQWRCREIFRKAAEIAKENGNERMNGFIYRW